MAIEEALNLVKQETPTVPGPNPVPTDPRTRTAAPIAVEGPLSSPRLSDSAAPEIEPFADSGRAAPRPMIPAGLHANDDRRIRSGQLSARPSTLQFEFRPPSYGGRDRVGSLLWRAGLRLRPSTSRPVFERTASRPRA